jgi:hypothetical protein
MNRKFVIIGTARVISAFVGSRFARASVFASQAALLNLSSEGTATASSVQDVYQPK